MKIFGFSRKNRQEKISAKQRLDQATSIPKTEHFKIGSIPNDNRYNFVAESPVPGAYFA